MNRIAVVGASGRTGQYVVEALLSSSSSTLCAALVSPSSNRLGEVIGSTGITYSSDFGSLRECDGVIDFSTPATTVTVARVCADYKKPLLVATTGLSVEDKRGIEECARVAPVCMAPNTSLAATALKMAARYLQGILGPSFDIEVMEIHHRMKKDAPSGTALNVISGLTSSHESVVFGREGLRKDGEIGVVSLRGGDIPGEHTVYFLGNGERIELTQRSQNRAIFGAGAVVLMERLIGKSAGLYLAEDLLQAVQTR
ncbi:MAG: dihydrodipicolinate reductase [Pseudomonadota bacterium]|jgi:4-hydroxy-tetrahydrodipicolinate reductase